MTLNVLSMGGGVQSSALLLLSCAGILPKLDHVVFADTQGEMPATYAHLEYLRGKAADAGIEFHVVTAGSLYDDVIDRAGQGMQPNPPVRVRSPEGDLARINKYFCSYDYKRREVTRKVKALCGPNAAWRDATVRQWIGYSTDEASRCKDSDECRCGHRRMAHDPEWGCHTTIGAAGQRPCTSGPRNAAGKRVDCMRFDPWQTNVWPLIDLGWTRTQVLEWLRDNGHPKPPRSACWFCPNRGNAHWRSLKGEHPRLWSKAVDLDLFVRDGLNGLKGEGFLHQSGTPLATAHLGEDGDDVDENGVAYDCDAGVCFT